VISGLLNGGVALDKMSYLMLDSEFTGVPFGRGIDLPALFRAATVVEHKSGGIRLAFHERAMPQLENLVFTRF
jgi:HD superfamily phosphohydrolase